MAHCKLDGESIVLGHEIEETVTDPGAEDILGGRRRLLRRGGHRPSDRLTPTGSAGPRLVH